MARLSDIPSNPDDVIITEIPSNLAISMNPISSSNLGGMISAPMNVQPNIINQMPQELTEKPKIIEEINTDIIPTDDINQNKQEEEPPVI